MRQTADRPLPRTVPPVAPPVVHQVLRSAGRPLEPGTRSLMESRFGHDFGRVRVHTDARAAESARAVGALAYTVGRHIAFGEGRYAPGSHEGRRLLAHELTHAVQQDQTEPSPSTALPVGPEQDAGESEADRAAQRVAGHRRAPDIVAGHSPGVRRLASRELICTDLRGRCREDSEQLRNSREAVRRMEATAAGQWLIEALESKQSLRDTTINMRFSSAVSNPESGIFGSFDPEELGAAIYNVWIDTRRHGDLGTATPRSPDSRLPAPVDTYGGGSEVIPSYVVESPSRMAETLFHELLHVWYLNTFNNLGFRHPDAPQFGMRPYTGHYDASQGEIERPFARRLREFARQIYRVETLPRPEQPQPPAPATVPPPDRSAPPPSPGPESRGESAPGQLSLVAEAEASVAGPARPGENAMFGWSLGFLYGRAIRFGAGADLLYLPNQGLFGVGGGVGVQFLQTEGEFLGGERVVNNPLFFDVRAGAVYMLSDEARLTLEAGLGMEVGSPGGWAPFWRIGGGLLATPTDAMRSVAGFGGLSLGLRTPSF